MKYKPITPEERNTSALLFNHSHVTTNLLTIALLAKMYYFRYFQNFRAVPSAAFPSLAITVSRYTMC